MTQQKLETDFYLKIKLGKENNFEKKIKGKKEILKWWEIHGMSIRITFGKLKFNFITCKFLPRPLEWSPFETNYITNLEASSHHHHQIVDHHGFFFFFPRICRGSRGSNGCRGDKSLDSTTAPSNTPCKRCAHMVWKPHLSSFPCTRSTPNRSP